MIGFVIFLFMVYMFRASQTINFARKMELVCMYLNDVALLGGLNFPDVSVV